MNCQADLHSWLESVQNYISRAARPCITWIPCLQRWRQVHPATSSTQMGTKFIHLGSHRGIRIIHIETNRHKANSWYVVGTEDDLESMGYKSDGLNPINKRKSLSLLSNYSEVSSEEYWFTRWNRPLKVADPCNCSFRKSWRNSLGDSQILMGQSKVLNDINQEFDCSSHHEKFVGPEISSNIQNGPSLQIESFAERMLDEIWSEVFSYFSKAEFKNHLLHHSISDINHYCNDAFDNDVELTCHNNIEFDSSINCENLDDFNCKTLISCQESERGVQIKEVNGLIEKVHNDGAFHSVGCINPSFLGSKTNPDLIEYAVSYDDSSNSEEYLPHRDFENFEVKEDMKCEDTDSGFNTASLESTNHHALETDCLPSRKDGELVETDNVCSDAVDPDGIIFNDSLSDVSLSTVINDKTHETKDIKPDNQISITSVDISLTDTKKLAEPELMLKKLNQQQAKHKQCHHAKHVRRLVSLYF